MVSGQNDEQHVSQVGSSQLPLETSWLVTVPHRVEGNTALIWNRFSYEFIEDDPKNEERYGVVEACLRMVADGVSSKRTFSLINLSLGSIPRIETRNTARLAPPATRDDF